MKYGKMPKGMWLIFRGSFARAAEKELGVSDGKALMRTAHSDYRKILAGVTEFDADSRFAVNIMSCAMVIAVLKNLSQKPTVEEVTDFYRSAMCDNAIMKLFLKKSNSYTRKAQETLRRRL